MIERTCDFCKYNYPPYEKEAYEEPCKYCDVIDGFEPFEIHSKAPGEIRIEAIEEFAERLKSHYSHSNSILKRIDAVKQELIGGDSNA